MKKILVFLTVLSVFVGLSGVVMANTSQDLSASVDENIVMSITPATIDFGPVTPGSSNVPAGMITFDPTGSNVDVQVTITSVTGAPFDTGLKLDTKLWSDPLLKWIIPCTGTGSCTYTPATSVPTLDVPATITPGLKPGVITYTVGKYIPTA